MSAPQPAATEERFYCERDRALNDRCKEQCVNCQSAVEQARSSSRKVCSPLVAELRNMAASSWANRYEWANILTQAADSLERLEHRTLQLEASRATLSETAPLQERIDSLEHELACTRKDEQRWLTELSVLRSAEGAPSEIERQLRHVAYNMLQGARMTDTERRIVLRAADALRSASAAPVDNLQVLKTLVSAVLNEVGDDGRWAGRGPASKLKDALAAARAVADSRKTP